MGEKHWTWFIEVTFSPACTVIIELPNLVSIGFPIGTQLQATSSSSKRSLKSTVENLEFDRKKITSITYYDGDGENNYETMEEFPNVKNITLDSLLTVSDNIIKDFSGTLTLPTSFNVDKSFIDKINQQGITIMANEINDNYNFADGVFYERGFREITGIVPQSETVVIREGIKNINKDLFSNNEKIKSLTLPSTVETIEDGAFKGCSSLSYVRCESESVQTGSSIFDDSSKVTVSVPPTYEGDSFGGADVIKEDLAGPSESDDLNPNEPDDPNVGLIVGVVIAVVVVVAVIVVGVICFINKRKKDDDSTDSPKA